MITLTDVTPAQIIHADAAAHEFDAIQLLRLCHTYLRGAEIRLPGGCRPLDRDKLARQINLYLNEEPTCMGRTDHQDPVCTEDLRPNDPGRT